MNDTMIDLYRAVQNHPRRMVVIGSPDEPWHYTTGDRVYRTDIGKEDLIVDLGSNCAKPVPQYHFLFQSSDDYHWHSYYTLETLLWLPPVWSEDGRCLWAILRDVLDGRPIDVEQDGDWFIVRYHDDEADRWWGIGEGVTLPEALLRAIGEQEGEKHGS